MSVRAKIAALVRSARSASPSITAEAGRAEDRPPPMMPRGKQRHDNDFVLDFRMSALTMALNAAAIRPDRSFIVMQSDDRSSSSLMDLNESFNQAPKID
jgi:hypothetical protein